MNPFLKKIEVLAGYGISDVRFSGNNNKKDVSTSCIQVYELDTIWVDSISMKSYFQPSEIKNEILHK